MRPRPPKTVHHMALYYWTLRRGEISSIGPDEWFSVSFLHNLARTFRQELLSEYRIFKFCTVLYSTVQYCTAQPCQRLVTSDRVMSTGLDLLNLKKKKKIKGTDKHSMLEEVAVVFCLVTFAIRILYRPERAVIAEAYFAILEI